MATKMELDEYDAAVATCKTPGYHETHRYCPSCPWTEQGLQISGGAAEEKSLGQIAYDAYGNMRGWRVVGGAPMPRWLEQSNELHLAWEGAARAVVREVASRALATPVQ